MAKDERWFELKALPTCSCGRPLCKKGMIRELRANKNNRPGPREGSLLTSVATIRLDCRACGRSWDARFLTVMRYEPKHTKPVPQDCWPIRWNESPEETLRHILENRRRLEAGEAPVERMPNYIPLMSQEDADRAKRHIAAARARFGWPS